MTVDQSQPRLQETFNHRTCYTQLFVLSFCLTHSFCLLLSPPLCLSSSCMSHYLPLCLFLSSCLFLLPYLSVLFCLSLSLCFCLSLSLILPISLLLSLCLFSFLSLPLPLLLCLLSLNHFCNVFYGDNHLLNKYIYILNLRKRICLSLRLSQPLSVSHTWRSA